MAAFLSLRSPIFPGAGLDPSWVLSTDHAVRTGAVFGTDYIFTYGPYFRLAAPLFDPDRFGIVLAYDVIVALMLCAPAIANRSASGVAAVVLALLFLNPGADAVLMAGLFAVFLTCLPRRNFWTLALAAACGPLVLSKLSLLLVFAPLMMTADALHAAQGRGRAWRRWPICTGVLITSVVLSLVLAKQPLSALPAVAANSLSIITGYSHAMFFVGRRSEAVLAVGLCAGLWFVAALVLIEPRWAQLKTPAVRSAALHDLAPILAAGLGLTWLLFVAFKAGFVRQDAHTTITFEAIIMAGAVLWGFVGRPFASSAAPMASWRRAGLATLACLIVGGAYVARSVSLSPQQGPYRAASMGVETTWRQIPERLQVAVGWLTGRNYREMAATRTQIIEAIRRPFPSSVSGTVDVIPYELSEIILSGLDYAPRPIIQSYSSYTPRLQSLDQAHFASASAPDTLFLKLQDIDGRLPTGALGPTLPVIGAHYDAVGFDPLGLILRKRSVARLVTEHTLGEQSLALNQWIALPRSTDVIMGRFDLPLSLAGKAASFLFRDPILTLTLRTASGRERQFRFVPDMAREGVAISPMPSEGSLAALQFLDPSSGLPSDPVTAMRIEGHGWAYPTGRVGFTAMRIAPGLAERVKADIGLQAALVSSDPTGRATLDGGEIFAPAPATLTAEVAQTQTLSGHVGVKAHPQGPPDDGVTFSVTSFDANGGRRTLFAQRLAPGPSRADLNLVLTAGSRVEFKTETGANANFDWSYWDLKTQPQPRSETAPDN